MRRMDGVALVCPLLLPSYSFPAPIPLAEHPRTRWNVSRAQRERVVANAMGVGNISAAPPRPVSPTDLETPTLKEEVYTTGRGGSGNMVANTGKAGARRAQDVVG